MVYFFFKLSYAFKTNVFKTMQIERNDLKTTEMMSETEVKK